MNIYDEDALEQLVKLLQHKPHTAMEAANHCGCSVRTIQRRLAELVSRGYKVVRVGVSARSPFTIL